MKRFIYKLLLLGFIAAFMSDVSIDLLAKQPATPKRVAATAEITETNPVKGTVKLTWFDGDMKNELGDYFRITQFKNVNGITTEKQVATVKRNNLEWFQFIIKDLEVADYCYTIDLYDEKNNFASEPSKRVCANVKEGVGQMKFLKSIDNVELDENGYGEYLVEVKNPTNCEYTVAYRFGGVEVIEKKEVNEGLLIKVRAKEKGLTAINLALYDKCTMQSVDELVVGFCYNDCNDNYESLGLEFYLMMERFPDAQAGESWRYDVDAFAYKPCEIKYYIDREKTGELATPNDMTIDENSGVVSWVNPIEGAQNVTIIAKAIGANGITEQEQYYFTIMVHPGEQQKYGVLTCNFTDETKVSKDYFGKVTVWSADEKDPNEPPTPNQKTYTVELRGKYISIDLPVGKYYLKAEAKGYKGQYYETAFELEDAKTISVGRDEEVEVDMVLRTTPEPEYFVITGQVTDVATGEPLQAVVTFQPVKWVLSGKSDKDDINYVEFDNRVNTDEKGNYSIKLPDTYTYYANAVSINNKDKYKLQWFEGADSYYEADIIFLESDLQDINFELVTDEATQGYMSGSVVDREGNIVMSTVIALHKGDNSEFKAVTRTDEKGYFNFSNLKYGEYVVLSLPTENSFVPGYYVTDDYATLKWIDATIVSVGDFTPTPELTILHAPSDKDRARGIARIEGRLLKGLKGLSQGSTKEGNLEDAINGGLVYLTDVFGDVVTHFVTDVEGYFELEGLEPGTYTLGIDKFGFETYSKIVEIDYSKSIEVVTEVILSQTPTSVNYQDFGTAKLLVSPMPVTNISNVSFDGKAGVSNIKLVDITGNVVYQTTLNTIDGKNNFDLDAKNITTGTYILVIENEEKSVAGSINIIK